MPDPYILADDAILRDEHYYLDSDARFLTLPRTGTTLYVSASAFDLLVRLTRACTQDDAWHYYVDRCGVHGETPDRDEFDSFWHYLSGTGVIEEANGEQVRTRPLSNLGLQPSETATIAPMTFASRVSLVLTMRCNLACKHCLRESSPLLRGEGELTTPEVLSLMEEIDANGATSLQLSGGELTVRNDILDIIRHIRNLRTHVQFLTNGFVLRPQWLRELADIQQAKGKGFFVHLSLDGATPETNDWLRGKRAFQRTIVAMEKLRDAGVTVVVETCLTPKNLGELRAITEICAERGVSTLNFHPISFTGRAGGEPLFVPMRKAEQAAREAKQLAAEYEGTMKVEFGYQFSPHAKNGDVKVFSLPANTTGAGMYHMAIGADGKVYPCIESVGAPSLVMGDVRAESTADIWRSPRWDLFRGGWNLDELDDCKGCVLHGNCSTQSCRCYAVVTGMGFYGAFKDCHANAEELWKEKAGCSA